eukprot:1144657-Pelagomonas_calceolata.AAC.9
MHRNLVRSHARQPGINMLCNDTHIDIDTQCEICELSNFWPGLVTGLYASAQLPLWAAIAM